MVNRSRGGCYTCKRRKKKCDETQPHCSRCIKSGIECEGYAPLESPDEKGVMRRAKPVPRQMTQTAVSHRSSNASTSHRRISGPSLSTKIPSLATSSNSTQPPDARGADFVPPPEAIWHHNTLATNLAPIDDRRFIPFPNYTLRATNGASLVESPGLGGPLVNQSAQNSIISQPPFREPKLLAHPQLLAPDPPFYGPISPVIEDADLGEDPEGTQLEMCVVPTLDPNTPDNALPFVLQSYARWIKLVIFEPSKVITQLREGIINRFRSERSKIILLSNIIGALSKTIELSPKGVRLVTYLGTDALQNISSFILDQPGDEREADRKNALEALSPVMELILIQRYVSSMSTLVGLMEASAPVFRRACPELAGQRINLPRAIMSPEMNIRHFATTDVILSITTGRPMLFQYDTTYPPDILEQMKDGRYGMHWLHGIADQYIVLLARINVLSEELGAGVSPQCVAEIEDEIRQVNTPTQRSADPVSTIWRFTVRECWRVAMYVYLYMVLCRTTADDPRVVKLVQSFVQLIETVGPGRHPDAFLYPPMMVIGASAYRKQDRAVIQRRFLGLQECSKPGRCRYDAVDRLMDLWGRADAENRPAVWHDLRISVYRTAGV